MIRVAEHITKVHKLLGHYGIQPNWLEVVGSVHQWCVERDVPETNPDRAAKCFVWPDRCLIVIQDEQSDAMIRAALDLMKCNGFGNELQVLKTDWDYLCHLVLHETAFYVLKQSSQSVRDRWAFRELVKFSA